MKNLVIFGASGNIGQKISYFAAQSAVSQDEGTNIYLVSRDINKVEGMALDIGPSLSSLGQGFTQVNLVPITYEGLSSSTLGTNVDCFIITAGGNRSIANLAKYNQDIMCNFAKQALDKSGESTRVVMVTSPVDNMIAEFNKVWSSRFDTSSVLGVSSSLTERRAKFALAKILSENGYDFSPADFNIEIYGVHNKAAINRNSLTVKGTLISDFIVGNSDLKMDDVINQLYKETFSIGRQVRAKTGSAASFSTASCACEISNAILYNETGVKIRTSIQNPDDKKVYAQPTIVSKNGIAVQDVPPLNPGDQIKFDSGINNSLIRK